MRLGLGLGLFKAGLISAGVRIFSAFQTRVINDGGTVESGTCVVNGINSSALLEQASFLLIPSGYKGGKLYAEIPTNGNGDLTWTRGSTAIRTNSSGLLESMGTGVPRLSYMYGSCPSALLEPQRTNSIRNSTMVGASTSPSTLPTNYGVSGITGTVVGIGTENGLSYVDIRFSGTASGTNTQVQLETTTAITASNGQTWTQSVYLKLINTSTPPTDYNMRLREGTATGVFVADGITAISPTTSLQRFTYTRTNTGALTERIQPILLFNQVAGNTYDYTIRIAQPQMELGAYVATPIFTSGATATRVTDSFSRSNIYTNGLISASGGTWFVEFRNNIVYSRDNASSAIFINTGTSPSLNDGFRIRNGGTQRFNIDKIVAGVSSSLYSTTTDTVKLAIKWNGTTADIFANGTKVVSATAFTTTAMEYLNGTPQVPTFIQQMALFPTPLSDTQLTQLTTL